MVHLIPGCWVTGFYLDHERQKPIIMGSIGVVPGSTSTINNCAPDDNEAFKTCVRSGKYAPNPITDGKEGKDGTAKTGGGQSDGTLDGNDNERVPGAEVNKPEVIKQQEEWCQEVAEKCKDVDVKTQMTGIVSQMLFDIQNNNGQLGTFYVNKVTGGLNDSIGQSRTYINKAISVMTEFIAKVKGYLKQKLTDAVNALVKALLRQDKTGNALTPVTEWFNNLLKDLNCKMADLGERLAEWLTNV